jgi:hypothetical protein
MLMMETPCTRQLLGTCMLTPEGLHRPLNNGLNNGAANSEVPPSNPLESMLSHRGAAFLLNVTPTSAVFQFVGWFFMHP